MILVHNKANFKNVSLFPYYKCIPPRIPSTPFSAPGRPRSALTTFHTSYCTTTISICSAAHVLNTSVSCVDLGYARPSDGPAWTHRRSGFSVPVWAAPRLSASQHHGLRVGKCVPRHSRDRQPSTPSNARATASMACLHGRHGRSSSC